MSIVFGEVNISALEKALETLKSGLNAGIHNDLERDGILQRFEYTFEICWKTMRRCLVAMGRIDISGSPKPILREALKERFLENLEVWFEFLEARNMLSHIYNDAEAKRIFEVVKGFPEKADELIINLRKLGNQI